jgi:Fe-S-cluster containining protein
MSRDLGETAAPHLLDGEADRIAELTGLDVATFAHEDADATGHAFLSLRTIAGSCYFYRDGQCGIYAARPFDCRMFPFDIIENAGRFYWIAYLELCPVEFGFDQMFGAVKRLLATRKVTRKMLHQMVTYGASLMGEHKFKIIEEVEWPGRVAEERQALAV